MVSASTPPLSAIAIAAPRTRSLLNGIRALLVAILTTLPRKFTLRRKVETMKAMIYERYGSPDVLELREVQKPVARDDEVLIRVRATTVSSGDVRARSLHLPPGFGWMARLIFGLTRPRQPILGI